MILEDKGSMVVIICDYTNDSETDDISRALVCASAYLLKGFQMVSYKNMSTKISITLSRDGADKNE